MDVAVAALVGYGEDLGCIKVPAHTWTLKAHERVFRNLKTQT